MIPDTAVLIDNKDFLAWTRLIIWGKTCRNPAVYKRLYSVDDYIINQLKFKYLTKKSFNPSSRELKPLRYLHDDSSSLKKLFSILKFWTISVHWHLQSQASLSLLQLQKTHVHYNS